MKNSTRTKIYIKQMINSLATTPNDATTLIKVMEDITGTKKNVTIVK